jgi:hypothetical protein
VVDAVIFVARFTWAVLNRNALGITLALVWAGVMLTFLMGDFT